MRSPWFAPAPLCCLLVLACAKPSAPVDRTTVQANDNRTPAGTIERDTLRVNLTLMNATWRPEADSGTAIVVKAFAEDGKAPQIPAPLIRVKSGTVVVATVRNSLKDSAIVVRGLFARPTKDLDSIPIQPGDSTVVRFTAGAPGTYFYSSEAAIADTASENETTGGAFVVDPVGGSPPDRIFVMNIWGRVVDSTTYSNALAINGRSWPNDERIDATVGDTVHWRWVNATGRGHPMHMHGFFFRVDAKGSPVADSIFPANEQRLAVTEFMAPFTSMALTWSPDREGNWLFHCHIGFHVTPDASLHPPPIMDANMRMDADPEKHMAGLVLGLRIHPKSGASSGSAPATKTLHLFVDEGKSRGFSLTGMGYVLQQGAERPAADSVVLPGTVIVTNRDVPTDVVITNRLKESTAVHWHGLELESYSDGVAGWSGMGKHLAPVIQPGDSFVAHLTLKRPGTFIYHTHMDDMRQMTSGLYGAVVVLEPGKEFDPSTDHVWVAGNDGLDNGKNRVVVNGDAVGPTLTFKAGVPHRMRFVNMGFALGGLIGVFHDKTFEPWRAIAKDGADLPSALAVAQKAPQLVVSGETYDYEWTPAPGRYEFRFFGKKAKLFSQTIVVR